MNIEQNKKKRKIRLYERRFEKVEKLGEGVYGKVYKVKLSENEVDSGKQQYYAIKVFKENSLTEGMDVTALREISILKEIKHENIVKLHDMFYGITSLFLAYEYVDIELSKILYSPLNLNESIIKNFMYQMLSGLATLHKNGVLHRDLKPQNLLINSNGILKIADFGFARFIASPEEEMTGGVISDWYRPPEILFGAKYYSYSIDVWSIGCIFGELILKEPLFRATGEVEMLKKIFSLLGVPDDSWPDCNQLPKFLLFEGGVPITIKEKFSTYSISKEGIDLLEKMLKLNPNKRISAEEALNDVYFKTEPFISENEEISKIVNSILKK